MRIFKALMVMMFVFGLTQGQADKHGNPVFNSIELSNEDLEGFELTSSYYTIEDNISNPNSSVYVSDNPTKEEYINFARNLPSNFFIVHQGPKIFAMIILLQKNEGTKTSLVFNIVNPNNGKNMDAICKTWGEISAKRVDELLAMEIDEEAKIINLPNNGKGLLFNGITYRIQSYDKLIAEVINLAKGLLDSEKEIENPVEFIIKESIGGILDFDQILDQKEQSFFLFDGVAYNKKDFSFFLWGQAVKRIGIKTSKKAIKLKRQILERKLTDTEERALEKGFETEIE